MLLDWESPTQTKRIKLCNVTMNEESFIDSYLLGKDYIYLLRDAGNLKHTPLL